MFLKGTVVEHQINNGAHPSVAKLVPIQHSQGTRSEQEMPWGGEGGGGRRGEVKPSHALMWDFPQHSSPVISYSSARHLRREARNKLCSSGYPSFEYIFSMAYFPILFFSYQVSHSIYPDQCKKGQNSCLAALEMLQLVLKLMLFQHRFLLLCTGGTTGCQCVCVCEVTPPPEPASHQNLSLKWLKASPIYMCLMVS